MVPAGTIIKAFVDEDVPLAMPAAAQAPLAVGAPPAPLQVQPQAAETIKVLSVKVQGQ